MKEEEGRRNERVVRITEELKRGVEERGENGKKKRRGWVK